MPEQLNIDSRAPRISEDGPVLKRFLGYFKPYSMKIVLIFIITIIVGLADTVMALATAVLMDLFSGIGQATSTGNPLSIHFIREWGSYVLYDFRVDGLDQARQFLWWLAPITLIVVVVRGVLHFTKEYQMWDVTYRILMKLKGRLFKRVVHLPLSYFDREKSGDALTRITYDISQLENSFRTTFILVKSLIYSLIFISALFFMDWQLTLMVLALLPLSGFVIKVFGDRIRKVSHKVSVNVADYTAFLGEAIAGSKVLKAFGREADHESRFDRMIRENQRYSMKIARLNTLHSPTQEILATAGIVAVILFCGTRMLNGLMTIGDLTGFIFLMVKAYQPIKTLGESNAVLQRALASSRRIFDLIDQPDESILIGSGTRRLDQVEGALSFREVNFAYHDDSPVLRGVNLVVKAGQSVALVGPSGGGKSTILNLIPRFYPIHEGVIELDGVDIKELELDYLRSLIAVVPQETVLFSGTVKDNIQLGRPDATTDEIIAAASAANADDFIRELSGGYQAEVGERGVQLSGGQRQRLALARAILRDPKILLLDEATSALDSKSEQLIQTALEKFQKNRTTVIIAHRLSTILSADKIAVIEDGQVSEIGSHDELFNKQGAYRRLYDSQFGVQEEG